MSKRHRNDFASLGRGVVKILVDSPEARLLKLTKRGVIYIEHKRWAAARQSCPRNKLIDLQG